MSRVSDSVDMSYAAACSEATLYSPTRGFFGGIAASILDSLAPGDWLDKFEKLPPAEKIPAVLANEELMEGIRDVLSRVQPMRRGKDARVSRDRRLDAARALANEKQAEALALASQAVLRAPPTGTDECIEAGVTLALSLWQRSECLMALQRPWAALADLRLALKEHLPARMRAAYYWRMGHCYRDLREATKAKVSYELAGRLLGNDKEAKIQLNIDIEGIDYSAKPKHPPDRPRISVTGGAKQNMTALSKLVKISEEEMKGRFAVANAFIKPGDVLLVDSPYAACLLSDNYGTHCLHCFKRLEDNEEEAPMWCPNCSGVAFCSIKCRDTAISTYHIYECPFLDLFIGSGMSILSYIALRMVTQAGLENCLSIHSKYISNEVKIVEGAVLNDIEGLAKKSKMKSRKERLNRAKKGLKTLNEKIKDDEGGKEESTLEENLELKAAQIYSLCTHSEQRKGNDYLKRIVMALFLSECVKQAGFFKSCEKKYLSKVEVSICELIVRNLQLLQFNAHEIYETIYGEHLFDGSKQLYIAVGIYPTGALFNHECYPAVARYFEGRKIVLRAIRPLTPGEVVSENYGPHFMVRSLKERQRSLTSRYWFNCDCRACQEDWPTLKLMNTDTPPYLRCPSTPCSGKFKANMQCLPSRCSKCSTNIDKEVVKVNLKTVNECVAQYQIGAKLMEEECTEEAIKVLCEGVEKWGAVGVGPHRETHLAQEAMRPCFAIAGNCHKVTVVHPIESAK